MLVSRVARRTSPDALAAHAARRAPAPRRRRAPRARASRRALAARCETVTRKQSASSGSCANVRTAQPRSTSRANTSGTGERASTKLPACASTSTPARRMPAASQPRSSTIAAQRSCSSSRLAGRPARPRRPTRTRSSPAAAARRAPRPAPAARGRSRRAPRRARSPSRTCGRRRGSRGRRSGPRDPRRRARGRPGRARRCRGRPRRCARRRAAASCSPVGLFGLQSQTSRTFAGFGDELLARQREAVAGLEREHLGARVAAGDGVQLVGRLRHQRAIAAAERELGAQCQDLVTAGADDDLARVRRPRRRRSRA